MKLLRAHIFPLLLILLSLAIVIVFSWQHFTAPAPVLSEIDTANCWTGAGELQIPITTEGDQIRYGRALIANTSFYLGPKGKVAAISNGMNCQNCHLEAGTKPWGNNYGAVASTYPKFRERSGQKESIVKRINDCLQRSLNGQALDSNSKEMKAMVAYIKWLGKDVPKGKTPRGTGIMNLAYLKRAADPGKGKTVYTTTCARCHGSSGEGQSLADQSGYLYPPLWGQHSFNTGAGLYRLSRFAGYVKNNMPNPVTYHHPSINDEEAWDVAAFVCSQPRPGYNISKDWPRMAAKPFDHPFGPYTDTFSEAQHKYGPWQEIIAQYKKGK